MFNTNSLSVNWKYEVEEAWLSGLNEDLAHMKGRILKVKI